VPKTTIRHRWRRIHYRSIIASKKRWLNRKHQNSYLQWWKLHKNWSFDDWNHIIWSDKCIFELGRSTCQFRALHPSDPYHYASQYLMPSPGSGGINGSVWGWFLGNFKDQFIILGRNLNGHSYTNILQHQFLSLMEIIPPKIWNIKFQHDEVPDYWLYQFPNGLMKIQMIV